MGQTEVDEALYRLPNGADGGTAHTLGAVHPGWRIAGERSGDLFVTHTAAGAFSDPANPLPGNHGGPLTSDNTFAIIGGGRLVRQQSLAGAVDARYDDTLRNPEQAQNVDVAPTALALLGRAAPLDSEGRVLAEAFEPGALAAAGGGPGASAGGARCAGQALRSRAGPAAPGAGCGSASGAAAPHAWTSTCSGSRAGARSSATGAWRASAGALAASCGGRAGRAWGGASTSCACAPAATCAAWPCVAALGASRAGRRSSAPATATRCGCSSSSDPCSAAAAIAAVDIVVLAAPADGCLRDGVPARPRRAALSRPFAAGGQDPPAAARTRLAEAGPLPDSVACVLTGGPRRTRSPRAASDAVARYRPPPVTRPPRPGAARRADFRGARRLPAAVAVRSRGHGSPHPRARRDAAHHRPAEAESRPSPRTPARSPGPRPSATRPCSGSPARRWSPSRAEAPEEDDAPPRGRAMPRPGIGMDARAGLAAVDDLAEDDLPASRTVARPGNANRSSMPAGRRARGGPASAASGAGPGP